MGGPGQAADETTCRHLRLPRPPSFPPFLSLPPRTTSRLPFLPSLSFFRPLRAISRSPRASGLGVSHVCPSLPLSPSLSLLGMARAGRPPPFPSSPRFSNFPSSGHLSAAVAPPPPPHRSFSLSFPATDRRSRINQTPSAFGFRPVGRSVNVRVRLPDRSSDDDLAGWSARSDRQTDRRRATLAIGQHFDAWRLAATTSSRPSRSSFSTRRDVHIDLVIQN